MEIISREVGAGLPLELLYSHDLILMADSEESLHDKIVKWKSRLEGKGLKMNTGKTKVNEKVLWETQTLRAGRAACVLSLAAQCIVISPVCVCVCGSVTTIIASIFTKLHLYVKIVAISIWLNFGCPAPHSVMTGSNIVIRGTLKELDREDARNGLGGIVLRMTWKV